MSSFFTLRQLGWRAQFSQQLSIEDLERYAPVRVANVQRSGATVWGETGESHVPAGTLQGLTLAVGDWALLDPESGRIDRLLERASLLTRLAAGIEQRVQPIAANIDTLFVVTSCNDDFNTSRLERYLAIAHDARVYPVIVLTKRDLCDDADALLGELEQIAPKVPALAVNATDAKSAYALLDWLTPAATAAFVGSSGVGKSTLVNTLTGGEQSTADIREADSKGRHTTTSRQMIAMPGDAWLIDTPGMRELKVGAVQAGIRATFDEIEALAMRCKFRDCKHLGEHGCAVRAAIEAGELSERRLANYHKLQREAKHATQSVFERREADRKFGRMYDAVKERVKRERGE
jgi:ribosome biogenesis GTPase / thiamine phosphate phosphatase